MLLKYNNNIKNTFIVYFGDTGPVSDPSSEGALMKANSVLELLRKKSSRLELFSDSGTRKAVTFLTITTEITRVSRVNVCGHNTVVRRLFLYQVNTFKVLYIHLATLVNLRE